MKSLQLKNSFELGGHTYSIKSAAPISTKTKIWKLYIVDDKGIIPENQKEVLRSYIGGTVLKPGSDNELTTYEYCAYVLGKIN